MRGGGGLRVGAWGLGEVGIQQQFSIVGGERGRSFCIYIASCLCLFLVLSPRPLLVIYFYLSLTLPSSGPPPPLSLIHSPLYPLL